MHDIMGHTVEVLCKTWHSIRRATPGDGVSDHVLQPFLDRELEIEHAIIDTPARSLPELVDKLDVLEVEVRANMAGDGDLRELLTLSAIADAKALLLRDRV